MKRLLLITLCLVAVIATNAQDNSSEHGLSNFQPNSLCQPFSGFYPDYLYYVLFDSEEGDVEQTGDVYYTQDSNCTNPMGQLEGWTIVYAPHGPKQAGELCGGPILRRYSARVYICEGS